MSNIYIVRNNIAVYLRGPSEEAFPDYRNKAVSKN